MRKPSLASAVANPGKNTCDWLYKRNVAEMKVFDWLHKRNVAASTLVIGALQ